MRRSVNGGRTWFLVAALLSGAGGLSTAQAPPAAPPATEGAARPDLTPEQIEEINAHRQIIMDSSSRPESRRVMAERLLKLDNPGRVDLVIELLARTAAPMPICEAIASVGARAPGLIDARWVEPLVSLLGSDDAALASKAAAALSAFRNGDVAGRLGALAASTERPMGQRLAAIDALALNTDQRQVVAELIRLIALPDRAIQAKVMDALRPASRMDHGDDVAAWQDWWRQKQQLDEADWLRDRLDLASQQNRAYRTDIARLKDEAAARRQRTFASICELLRTNLQLTQPTQRETSLIEWLGHTMVEYRLCALALVRERISEGDPPGEGIRAAVKACLSNGAPEVRIEALEIVGNLKDPRDAADVLKLLDTETDPAVRETVLRVLGRLDDPAAINALVAELASPTASNGCVREAAIALGSLCRRPEVPASAAAAAVEPLRQRFALAPADKPRLKEALLGAMASIGDGAFLPDFTANLSSEQPELVVAAIRGVARVGAKDQLDRVLGHLDHPDPRVRQVAATAVGTLGSTAVHLEALYGRLNPDVETNEGVRNAAWDGFRAVLSANPSLRWAWIDRLDRYPDRQIALLDAWIASAGGANAASPELNAAREKLAAVLLAQGKYADAVPHLQQLWSGLLAADDPKAESIGLDLLRACLNSGRHERIEEIIVDLCGATSGDREWKTAVADVLFDYLEELLATGNTANVAPLLKRLRSLPEDAMGPEWTTRLDEFAERALPAADPAAPPPP